MESEVMSGPDKFRTIVYGIAAAATLTYTGWLGSAMLDVADRLTRMETTITENRQERNQQITNLERRLDRLEDHFYPRRRQRNGDEE